MMSCGTSSRYGSSLLLKTTDFSIQGAWSFRRWTISPLPEEREEIFSSRLFCGLFKCSQDGIAARHGGIERLLGGFLPGERGFDFLGPDVAHLHHVAEAQAARILGRPLVGELLQRRLENRILLVE